MTDRRMEQEVKEAIEAGERALSSLYAAKEKLNSARSWGIFDMFGGGLLTDMIKHSRIRDASRYLEDARYDLQTFQRELRDVSVNTDLGIEIGGFLSFADFFFDGLVADYFVQSKITDAREQVADAISQTERLLEQLRMV